MPRRPGVSLVEVLVATVLLAVGVMGCVAALHVATRLRLEATAREGAAALIERRLAWFETRACLGGDTVIVVAAPESERWVVDRDSATVSMEGRAERIVASRVVRVPLRALRGCP